jgi:hypothetical protein
MVAVVQQGRLVLHLASARFDEEMGFHHGIEPFHHEDTLEGNFCMEAMVHGPAIVG